MKYTMAVIKQSGMRRIVKLSTVLLILASSFSCEKAEEKLGEPKEISFMDYSLVGTFCEWTNLDYDGKTIIINSKSDLKKYITCMEGNFPEVDFSKNTLLLTSGVSSQNIGSINTALFKYSTMIYGLEITVIMGNFMVVERWHTSILIPKIDDNAKINLKIDYLINN